VTAYPPPTNVTNTCSHPDCVSYLSLSFHSSQIDYDVLFVPPGGRRGLWFFYGHGSLPPASHLVDTSSYRDKHPPIIDIDHDHEIFRFLLALRIGLLGVEFIVLFVCTEKVFLLIPSDNLSTHKNRKYQKLINHFIYKMSVK